MPVLSGSSCCEDRAHRIMQGQARWQCQRQIGAKTPVKYPAPKSDTVFRVHSPQPHSPVSTPAYARAREIRTERALFTPHEFVSASAFGLFSHAIRPLSPNPNFRRLVLRHVIATMPVYQSNPPCTHGYRPTHRQACHSNGVTQSQLCHRLSLVVCPLQNTALQKNES